MLNADKRNWARRTNASYGNISGGLHRNRHIGQALGLGAIVSLWWFIERLGLNTHLSLSVLSLPPPPPSSTPHTQIPHPKVSVTSPQ